MCQILLCCDLLVVIGSEGDRCSCISRMAARIDT